LKEAGFYTLTGEIFISLTPMNHSSLALGGEINRELFRNLIWQLHKKNSQPVKGLAVELLGDNINTVLVIFWVNFINS
jgi:hypothetical protein